LGMRKKPASQKLKRRKHSIPLRWQARVAMHSPSFRWLAYRQARMANRSPCAAEDQAWADAMTGSGG